MPAISASVVLLLLLLALAQLHARAQAPAERDGKPVHYFRMAVHADADDVEHSGDAASDDVGFAAAAAARREEFWVGTTDAALAARAVAELALPVDARRLFVTGTLAPTSGGFNGAHPWHFPIDAWQLSARAALSSCDALPSAVDADVDAWLRARRFCPSRAYVKSRQSVHSAVSQKQYDRFVDDAAKAGAKAAAADAAAAATADEL